MKIFRSFEEASSVTNPVVTTGSFDGVHLGHLTILNRLKIISEKCGGESVLITFDPHPRKILYPDTTGKDLKMINSQEEKLYLLEKAGLDNIIIIEFTREFSRITSEEFVRDILHGILKARVIVVGFNHHFGFNREGDYRQLWGWQEKYSFEAEEIPEQDVQNETVSSTEIRKAISQGNIQRANAYLDHYYLVMGRLESFDFPEHGRLPSLTRISLADENKLLPPPGIYAVSVDAVPVSFKGMVIVGGSGKKDADVLISSLDGPGLVPGDEIRCFFHKRISGAVSLDRSSSVSVIFAAKEEILELIY